ncbi:MAG: 4Fe-4S dicluster domain-containing protein [Coriobacteriia bacterium]
MKALNPGVHKTAPDQRVIIKSLKRVDMGPFMRYSCWHCVNPPCAAHCPFKAIKKMPNGAVAVDHSLCRPGATNPTTGVKCTYQCTIDCGRGGYPKVGEGSDLYSGAKSNKCTLCYGRAGSVGNGLDATYGTPLPTKESDAAVALVPEKAHQPACVYTCPAKAMTWDTFTNVRAYINDTANGFISAYGDGSMYWASRKFLLIAPKADPFVEDHLTPLVSNLVSGPFAKAALVPTLLAGGLMAVIARRQHLANETTGEV